MCHATKQENSHYSVTFLRPISFLLHPETFTIGISMNTLSFALEQFKVQSDRGPCFIYRGLLVIVIDRIYNKFRNKKNVFWGTSFERKRL